MRGIFWTLLLAAAYGLATPAHAQPAKWHAVAQGTSCGAASDDVFELRSKERANASLNATRNGHTLELKISTKADAWKPYLMNIASHRWTGGAGSRRDYPIRISRGVTYGQLLVSVPLDDTLLAALGQDPNFIILASSSGGSPAPVEGVNLSGVSGAIQKIRECEGALRTPNRAVKPRSRSLGNDWALEMFPALDPSVRAGTYIFIADLAIDDAGHPTRCDVVQTSGLAANDAVLCKSLMRTAYVPATDATGTAIAARHRVEQRFVFQ